LRPKRIVRAGEGSTFYNWRGSSALQEDIAFGPRLEALANLDRAGWIAIGVIIEPACTAHGADTACIEAVHLASLGLGSAATFRDVMAYSERHGFIPATRIVLDGRMSDLLRCMKTCIFHLRASWLADIPVTEIVQPRYRPAADDAQ
jgi:hypothetical protein